MKLFFFLLLVESLAFSAPSPAPAPKQEMSAALKEATANLALSGGSADAKYNLALVLASESKWKEASLFFKQASDSLSGNKISHEKLVNVIKIGCRLIGYLACYGSGRDKA